jgi:hypothetical protein
MMMRPLSFQRSKQVFTLLLGVMLGLAIFISPYQLHHNSASIFFKTPAETQTAAHTSHEHQHQNSEELRCLRCVLQGFELPETIEPFIIIFITLGFLIPAKPSQPFSFIVLTKTARAPPVIL